MLDVMHFHPSEKMSNLFVAPLLNMESKSNIKSKLIVSNSKKSGINFSLSINNLLTLPFAYFRLLQTINKNSPKLVIAHNTTSAFLPLLAARVCGVKHVIYFNHGVSYLGHTGLIKVALKIIEQINCKSSTEIITVSHDMLYTLKQLSEKPISLIHNGSACGITRNRNNKANDSLRKYLGFKDSDFLVAYIGRLEKRKGFYFALDVWEKFFANKAGFKFLIYGNLNPNQSSKLKKLNNIFYMGFSNNIPRVLKSVDCIILPSRHEGLSYISLEAALYKCPVICSKIPGLKEIIKNNLNGLIVNRDYASYAKAIKRLQIKKLDTHVQEKYSKELYRKYNRDDFSRAYIKFLRERIYITNS